MWSFSLKSFDFPLPSRRSRIAATLLDQARTKPPGLAHDLLVSIASLLGGREFRRDRLTTHLLARADDAFSTSRWKEAEQCLSAALERVPDFPAAHFARGIVFLKIGRPRRAVVDFERATRSADAPAEWFHVLGNTQERLGNLPAAADALRNAIARSTHRPKWNERLARICQKIGQPTEMSLAEPKAAPGVSPKKSAPDASKPVLWQTHETLLAAATAASKDQHWPLAANLWQMAIDNFQGADRAHAALCEARRNLVDFATARRVAEEGLRRFPDSRPILAEWALLEITAGEWCAALELWQKAGDVSQFSPPREVHAFAHTCEMLGQWDRQRETIKAAVAARKKDPSLETRIAFGEVMQELGAKKYADVMQDLKRLSAQPWPKHFPCATKHVEKSAKLHAALAGLTDPAKRIRKISASITRPSPAGCRVGDLVGLPELLLAHFERNGNEAVRELAQTLQSIAHVCGVTAELIQLMPGSELHRAIQRFSTVLDQTETRSKWLPTGGWLTLSTLALAGGRFDLYHRCRSHAFDLERRFSDAKIESGAPFTLNDLRRVTRLAAESGDEKLFSALRERYDRLEAQFGPKNCANVRAAALYFGERGACVRWTARKVSSGDRLLRRSIKGKSIAIVGPVDVGLDHGDEIDSFDLVIRFNYRGLATYATERFGRRTDIGYYVRTGISRPNYAAFERAMNQLKLVNVDSNAAMKQHAALLKRVKVPLRKRHPIGAAPANPFLKGTPNGVQRVLFDLMRFETGRIKVFNSNLWISNDVAPDYKHTQKFTYRDLVRHDAISNFVFMQRTHAHGLIEADAVLSNVLKMSVDDYVAALQERYGSRQIAA